jgi:ATP-dependent Clp protease ATP-binding subunit ClpA
MFERFTEDARRTVFYAQEWARRFGSSEIEPEHLLLGIMAEEDLATYLLARTSPEELFSQIKHERAHPNPLAADAQPQISNLAKNILTMSSQAADRRGEKPIGNEHLLLGFLNASKSYAAQLLLSKSVSSQTVEERITDLRKDPSVVTKTNRHRFIPKISWLESEE